MGRHVCFWLLDTCRCIFHNVLVVQVLLYLSVYAYTNGYEIYTGLFPDVRAFAHGAMGRRIDPSWGGPIELFLVPASAPRLV